jgi:hypothetical protein
MSMRVSPTKFESKTDACGAYEFIRERPASGILVVMSMGVGFIAFIAVFIIDMHLYYLLYSPTGPIQQDQNDGVSVLSRIRLNILKASWVSLNICAIVRVLLAASLSQDWSSSAPAGLTIISLIFGLVLGLL